MFVQNSLLHCIFFSKGVVDVWKLISSRHLVVWIKRVSQSVGHRTLFKWTWLSPSNICNLIGLFILSSLTSVEISKSLGADRTSQNIISLERGILITLIFSWFQHNLGDTSLDLPDFGELSIFVPVLVRGLQRIARSFRFKLVVSNVSIIHDIVFFFFSIGSTWMKDSGLCTLDITDF